MKNISGVNINIKGSFVYVYTTDMYMEKNFFKIGGTDLQSVSERVEQQDSTSTAEELIIVRAYNLDGTRYDENSNAAEKIMRKDLKPTRKDKKREWRVVDNLEVLDEKAESFGWNTYIETTLLNDQVENLIKENLNIPIETIKKHTTRLSNNVKDFEKIFNDLLKRNIVKSGFTYEADDIVKIVEEEYFFYNWNTKNKNQRVHFMIKNNNYNLEYNIIISKKYKHRKNLYTILERI